MFRVTAVAKAGGGAHPPTPKVWSPAGGWYVNPPNWKRACRRRLRHRLAGNTGIAFLFMFSTMAYVFCKSAELERRPMAPKHPIPSSRWSKVLPVKGPYED